LLDDGTTAGRDCLDLEVTSGNAAERDELVGGLELLLSDRNHTNRFFGDNTINQSAGWDESISSTEGVLTPQPFNASSAASKRRLSSQSGFLSAFMRRRSSGVSTASVGSPSAARLSYFSRAFSSSIDKPAGPVSALSPRVLSPKVLSPKESPRPETVVEEDEPPPQEEDPENLAKITPNARERLRNATLRARQLLPPPSPPASSKPTTPEAQEGTSTGKDEESPPPTEDSEGLERITPHAREKLRNAALKARQHLPPPSPPASSKPVSPLAREGNITGA